MSQFFLAGGYGVYLWSAYGITALLMLVEILMVRQQFQAVLRRVKRILSSGL